MNKEKIFAVVLRYFLLFRNSWGRIFEIIFWLSRDIVMWGLTGIYITNTANNPKFMLAMLTGVALWAMTTRNAYASGMSVFEDIVSNNTINIYSTPIKIYEWVAGVVIMSLSISFVSFIFTIILSKLLYGVNILSVGFVLLPSILGLSAFGLSLGMISCGLTIYWGMDMISVIYILPWLFAPFVGIFTPLEILRRYPGAIFFSYLLPPTYIFLDIRDRVLLQHNKFANIYFGLFLSLIYFVISLLFFLYMFKKSKEKGLKP